METLVAACGLVCSQCSAYVGTKKYDYALICKTAEEWTKRYGVEVKPEDVWCSGCMTEGGPKCAHCAHGCEIRACVKEKMYHTCGDCSVYPCAKVDYIAGAIPGTRALLEALRQQ